MDKRSSTALPLRRGRERLAEFWNSWFSPREIERIHAMAEIATDEECDAEYDRLMKERDSRLEQWRWSQ